MSGLDDRYRRLLRWYPARWRAAHGEVVLGTLLEAADGEGRRRPTVGETWTIRLSGIGERLTSSTALVLSCVALVAACCAQGLLLGLFGGAWRLEGGWPPLVLTGFVSPALVTAAVLGLLRHARMLLPIRAVGVLLASTAAWALNFVAAWSWSIGFDEADAGGPRSALGSSFVVFFVAACVVGAVAVALLVGDLGAGLPLPVRWSSAFAAAVVAPPVAGAASSSPILAAFAAGALVVCSSVLTARSRPTAADRRTPAAPARAVTGHAVAGRRVRREIALVAGIALLLSSTGIVLAFTGSLWTPLVDGTQAMQVGLGVGSLGLVPLLFGYGRLLALRRPDARAAVRTGSMLTGAGLGAHAVLGVLGLISSGTFPWWAVLPAAAGVGVVVGGVVRLGPAWSVLIGVATALGVVVPLWSVLTGAAFLACLAAVVTLASTLRGAAGRRNSVPMSRVG